MIEILTIQKPNLFDITLTDYLIISDGLCLRDAKRSRFSSVETVRMIIKLKDRLKKIFAAVAYLAR